MIIEVNFRDFCIRNDETVNAALSRIDQNNEGFTFCIDDDGVLTGVLTDGDVRRWLMKQTIARLDTKIFEIENRDFVSAHIGAHPDELRRRFSEKIRFIPLLDEQGRLQRMARRRKAVEELSIGARTISDHSSTFTIAEIGINHNGSPDRARKLIETARDAGVDCVKFQLRNLDALYREHDDSRIIGEDLGAQYTLRILKKYKLPVETMLELFDYVRELGLIPLCTPWEAESLAILEEYGMVAYKVASADLTNHPFLSEMCRTFKPLILSTGMSTESEIRESVELLSGSGASFGLLHCNSTYPAPFKDINLDYLPRLKEIGQCVVGYSGHERGINIAVAAVAKGAKIIEKHITLDKNLEGPDHRVSLLPDELKALVEGIRQVEDSLGTGRTRSLSQGEIMNRANLSKSLVIKCDLAKGAVIEESMIEVKSPGRGLQPNRRDELIGRMARRDFSAGDFFFPSDVEKERITARNYAFSRPWGLTVRWHDFKEILGQSNPDFLEFHLSFKDMDEDYLGFFSGKHDLDLKVHSPDIFKGDHLLDLANPDAGHRSRSVRELQRVIDLTRRLQPFFRKAERPVIIASLGGFTEHTFLSELKIHERYEILAESLAALDDDGVEIIGQTLPPFPWYFGGQLHLNLFVRAEDTARFCASHDLRLCFDISHSKLACNHFKESLKLFVDHIAPHTAHLHVADAHGLDGEGIQVREGELDWPAVIAQLNGLCPGASFIPEIWQGHKNGGEGFWTALERLEEMGL